MSMDGVHNLKEKLSKLISSRDASEEPTNDIEELLETLSNTETDISNKLTKAYQFQEDLKAIKDRETRLEQAVQVNKNLVA